MTDHETRPNTIINEAGKEFYDRVKTRNLSVLCGRNNCGKSFLLRKMVREIGRSAMYLGPARYHNFNLLNPVNPVQNRGEEKWQRVTRHFENTQQNIDNSPLDLGRAIAELRDDQRASLITIMDELLDSKMEVMLTIPDNEMSQKFVSVDGYNISFTSSGYRLIATLLTSLLDDDYDTVLIDEPELGISPEIQGILADFLYDDERRKEFFPHLKSVVLATHSPVFLDRTGISNNYFVSKENSVISLRPIETIQELNDLQFFLLGNRFETMFLPSAIVLVEGLCDYEYIKKLTTLKFPKSLISVIQCNSDSRIREVIHIARQMLTDIQRSPYSQRIFAVIDQVHGQGLVDSICDMGVARENVIVWQSNGIEFYYPRSLLEKQFGQYTTLTVADDRVSANGISMRKTELQEYIVANLTDSEELPDELDQQLIRRLSDVTY